MHASPSPPLHCQAPPCQAGGTTKLALKSGTRGTPRIQQPWLPPCSATNLLTNSLGRPGTSRLHETGPSSSSQCPRPGTGGPSWAPLAAAAGAGATFWPGCSCGLPAARTCSTETAEELLGALSESQRTGPAGSDLRAAPAQLGRLLSGVVLGLSSGAAGNTGPQLFTAEPRSLGLEGAAQSSRPPSSTAGLAGGSALNRSPRVPWPGCSVWSSLLRCPLRAPPPRGGAG